MITDRLSQLRRSYLSSLKSYDTEEHIDLWFYRPIGYTWACIARRIGISANAITIAGIFIGMAAGVLFYPDSLGINAIGMGLLVLANSFDSADGQLARMTGCYSRLGRILDGMCGDVWFITIYVALCQHENHFDPYFHDHPWVIWTLAVVTGFCHASQAKMADYYRQFHLFFLKGEDGSELESAAKLRERLSQLSWRHNFWQKITLSVYTRYTAGQEAWTPAMQRFRAELRRRYPDGKIPSALRHELRAMSLPLMKYTNILSFNWRTIVLFVSIIVRHPWIYFVFELVVLNALLIYMVWRHERMCRTLTQQLEDGRY